MKYKLFSGTALLLIVLSACKKDNYDAPAAFLSGKVVYQGQPIGVRSNGVQLELWQPGYAIFNKIPVYVHQDGTYSANLFDGDYKLTRLKGNGPWVDNTDTINVQVRGTTVVDVPVTPYYVLRNPSFQKSGTALTASVKVDTITAGRAVSKVTLFTNSTQFVDVNTNNGTSGIQEKSGTALSNLSQPLTFSLTPPASLTSKGYIYARIGIQISGVGEWLYTPVQKVTW